MRIGMTYDLRTSYLFRSGDPKDANAEFDHPDTVQVIADALTALGHEVIRIGNVEQLLARLDRLEADLVFNIAEGYAGRNRESQVPILLELRGFPYVGSDGLTQAATLDKLVTKRLLKAEGIPTPDFFQIHDPNELLPKNLTFPLMAKPRYEGSSKGLSEQSIVRSEEELRSQAAWIIETYHQPALVEAFICGTEYTIALIGNNTPETLPTVQIQIDGKLKLGELFYTHSRIAAGADYICPAQIDAKLDGRLKALAQATYRAVDCLDFGRVDFRVDEAGRPYVLELNPLPSLSTEDVFMIVAKQMGLGYADMIGRIVDAAVTRQGLQVLSRPENAPAAVAVTGSAR